MITDVMMGKQGRCLWCGAPLGRVSWSQERPSGACHACALKALDRLGERYRGIMSRRPLAATEPTAAAAAHPEEALPARLFYQTVLKLICL